eukprot:1146872-Pelagomonas_calceolata.AAC.10
MAGHLWGTDTAGRHKAAQGGACGAPARQDIGRALPLQDICWAAAQQGGTSCPRRGLWGTAGHGHWHCRTFVGHCHCKTFVGHRHSREAQVA